MARFDVPRGAALAALVLSLSPSLACSTPPPPAATAPTSGGEEDEGLPREWADADAEAAGAPRAQAEPTASPPIASGSPSAPEATPEDVRRVLQLVIEEPEIQGSMYLGSPGRLPFKISQRNLPTKPDVMQGGKPAVFVEGSGSKDDPVFVVTQLQIDGAQAWVKFRYDAEGITGSASLEKTTLGWQLVNSSVVEH
jgi:hypothetical protein